MCATVAVGTAACGSDSSSSSASSGSGSSGSGSSSSASTTAAKSFDYGYSIATGQNPWMTAIGTAAQAVTAPLGGKADVTDAQLDPAKAVPQIQRFITDGVNSITVAPAQVPQSVQAVLTRAHDQGIHTFALEWSYADLTGPPPAPIDGQVLVDRSGVARGVADAINRDNPNGAKVIYIGLPYPVVGIDYFEATLKSALGSSRLVANLDNPSDNAQGALGPLQGAISANPDANAVVTYNGPSALAAVQAVRSAGLTDRVKVYNIQLDTATAAAVRDGTITASWDLNPPQLGTALGRLIAAAGTGAPKSEWARTVMVRAPEYTRDNIDSWQDWATK
ncbi:MAG TPA: sugar ABC transporter substrate-binding protein [Conexibacter sp.]